jgi:hypothetical protein
MVTLLQLIYFVVDWLWRCAVVHCVVCTAVQLQIAVLKC